MLQKTSLKLFAPLLIVSFAALSGCGTLTVYNKTVCADLGKYGAHCAETLTDKKFDVPKAEWDRARIGYLCMDSQSFTDTETTIDQACVELKCTYKTREQLRQAINRFNAVRDLALKAKRKNF